MTPKRLRKFRDVLDHRQPDLTVLMENVHKPHNLAAIARTCDAVGIPHVHAVSQYALTQLTQKSASGTGKWVNIHTHRTLEEAYATLRRSGFHLLAAHFFPDARDFRDIDYRRPTAIVVGAERDGISERAVSGADDRIFIPMAGMVESLNVSVATALILFEAKRQRQRAGFYETPRLDKKTYKCLLFEWCYPRVAAYCRSQGLAYPRMNSFGDITEPVIEGGFRSDACGRCKEGGNRGP